MDIFDVNVVVWTLNYRLNLADIKNHTTYSKNKQTTKPL